MRDISFLRLPALPRIFMPERLDRRSSTCHHMVRNRLKNAGVYCFRTLDVVSASQSHRTSQTSCKSTEHPIPLLRLALWLSAPHERQVQPLAVQVSNIRTPCYTASGRRTLFPWPFLVKTLSPASDHRSLPQTFLSLRLATRGATAKYLTSAGSEYREEVKTGVLPSVASCYSTGFP